MAANVGLDAAPHEAVVTPGTGHAGPRGTDVRWSIPDPVATGMALGLVALPFLVALVRILAQSDAHLDLTDDLALIELHTRKAVAWQQQLGVFDRNGWNHPGPAYFYLQGIVQRVFGSNPRSLFVGATLCNGGAAVACVGVVRRWTSPTRALWCALVVSVLAYGLAASGSGSTTYSETVLGALVSPWNPLVVILPLLLFLVLSAGTMTGSGVAAVGALVLGSYVVQTDISTLPLVAVVLVIAEAVWLFGVYRRRSSRPVSGATVPPDTGASGRIGGRRVTSGRVLVIAGLALLVLMWVPPLVQQVTNHPGNLTVLYDYFTSGARGQAWGTALSASGAAAASFVLGPSEVMPWVLWGAEPHHVVAALSLAATIGVGLAAALLGTRARSRFAAGLGWLVVAGSVILVVAADRVIGILYGYLLVWAVVLPAAAAVAMGSVGWPGTLFRGNPPRAAYVRRVVLVALLVAASAATVARVATTPPLARASDPEVAQLAALVTPGLHPGEAVAVNDESAGTAEDRLINLERFFGLVNLLDRDGFHPTVNHLWQVELGPGYAATGGERVTVELTTWTRDAPSEPGYRGRVGDMAVLVQGTGPTTTTR